MKCECCGHEITRNDRTDGCPKCGRMRCVHCDVMGDPCAVCQGWIAGKGGGGVKDIELTADEERAIRALKRLAKTWPQSLLVFCGGTGMSIRKGGSGAQCAVDCIDGIPNDGGDGGDEF